MKTLYIFIILIAAILTSCETTIDFNGKDTNPLLVVNSIISPDSAIKVHVSESRFFLEDDSKFVNLNNATVKLLINNVEYEQLKPVQNGYYLGTYVPKPGDKLKIIAYSSKYEEVSATTEIIPANPVLSVDTSTVILEKTALLSYNYNQTTPDTIGFTINNQFKINVNFNDPANVQNFYKITLKMKVWLSDGTTQIGKYYFNSDDVVFGSTSESGIFDNTGGNYYHVFSDDLFDGKSYSLKLSSNFYSYLYFNNTPSKSGNLFEPLTITKNELIVELQSISKSYYLYLKTRDASNTFVDFFSEPIQIFSNIQGGIGIFGSYNSALFKFEVPLKMNQTYYYYSK